MDQGFAFLSEEKADDLNAYAVCDDIIFTAAGTIGQVGIIPKDSRYQKYIISNKQLRIRIDPEKADPTFVYYWLASPWIFTAIQNRNTGSTVPLINLGTIRSLPILLPECLEDQRRIARTLGAIDEKIEVNKQINDELEGMARLLYDYWFVQFDFPITATQAATMGKPRLEGKPYRASGGKMVYDKALKREIPCEWVSGNLESLGTIVGGSTRVLKCQTTSRRTARPGLRRRIFQTIRETIHSSRRFGSDGGRHPGCFAEVATNRHSSNEFSCANWVLGNRPEPCHD